jgi:hypothetical protein
MIPLKDNIGLPRMPICPIVRIVTEVQSSSNSSATRSSRSGARQQRRDVRQLLPGDLDAAKRSADRSGAGGRTYAARATLSDLARSINVSVRGWIN